MFKLKNYKLFEGLDNEHTDAIKKCLKMYEIEYDKNNFIWHAGDTPKYVYLIVSGQVNLIIEDIKGNREIIMTFSENTSFGEAYAFSNEKYRISAVAKVKTKLIRMNKEEILSTCAKNCDFHKQIIKNLVIMLAEKNLIQNTKIDYLSKKSIRDKLSFYLFSESSKARGNVLYLNLNREELADFLGVDRSALSREMSKMKAENLIDYKKNKIEILDLDELFHILKK